MPMTFRPSIAMHTAGLLALGMFCLAIPAEGVAKSHATTKPVPLTRHEQAQHALDRLTFGPRPGDVERVEKIGVERWIELQLHPERIDDARLDTKLNDFPAMRLSTEELIRRYPPPPIIRQVDAGRIGIPDDPVERAIYGNAMAEFQQRKEARRTQRAESSWMLRAVDKYPQTCRLRAHTSTKR